MQYFDSKEEVLDIELTQYGRYLLSKGVWKPHYYAFFDENVVYDSQYGIGLEATASAEARIQDETPLFKTQVTFTGRDEYLYDGVNDEDERNALGLYEKLNVLPYYLGNSSLDSTKTPAYKVQFLEGRVKSLENNLTGNLRTERTGSLPAGGTSYAHQLLKIPQIQMDVEFKISVVSASDPQYKFKVDEALTKGITFADGNKVVIGPEQILMVVEEENAPFDYENFDIEVFEMTGLSGSLGEEIMNPLYFTKPIRMVEGNLLVDRKEAERKAGRPGGRRLELDPTFVDYYFNVRVDEEISENAICSSIRSLKSEDILVDVDINCPDIIDPTSVNIYGSDSTDEDCPDY